MYDQSLDHLIDTLRKNTARQQNTYQLIAPPQQFVADLIHEINSATSSIMAQFYTFEADTAGRPVAQALIRAQQRGVRTCLMIDHYINISHNDVYLRLPRGSQHQRRLAVAEWRETNKLITHMRQRGVTVTMLNPLGALYHKIFWRDHKKLIAIDADKPNGGVSYIGGVNISDHNIAWHDFMVKIHGPASHIIYKELVATKSLRSTAGAQPYDSGVFMTDTRGHQVIMPFILQLMASTQQYITVESPYLWGRNIMQALSQAAARGVRVAVVIPRNNNHTHFVPTRRAIAQLRGAGAQVHHRPGMTHAKALLADDIAVFGSSNFNEFLAGKMGEACIATSNPVLVRQLGAFLAAEIAGATTT